MGYGCEQTRYMQYKCPSLFLATQFAYSVCDAPWTQNSGRLEMPGSSARLKASTRKACYICNWVTRVLTATRNHTFLKPELASNTEKRQWLSKKYQWPRNLILSFLTCVTSLYYPTTDTEMIQKKKETGLSTVPFLFSPSLLPVSQWSKYW